MWGKKSSEVIVVGAGPVGLFAALRLAQLGVQVKVIDEQHRPTTRSYALALQPSALELFAQMELLDELRAAGRPLSSIAYYEGANRSFALKMAELSSRFPYLLVLPQARLEEILIGALERHRVELLWNHRLAHLEVNATSVTLNCERLAKESVGYAVAHTEWVVERDLTLRAGFAIGADGHTSQVRRELGQSFDEVAPAQAYAVFEFTAEGPELDEARIALSSRTDVLWPLGANRYRCSFEVELAENERGERDKSRVVVVPGFGPLAELDASVLSGLLGERMPFFEARVGEVDWSVAVRFEQRMANEWGRGRTWLAGDAAHLSLPIGTRSMNAGFLEACDLSSRLAAVLRQDQSPVSVAAYGQKWQAQFQKLLLATSSARAGKEAPAWVQRHAAQIACTLPAAEEEFERGAALFPIEHD